MNKIESIKLIKTIDLTERRLKASLNREQMLKELYLINRETINEQDNKIKVLRFQIELLENLTDADVKEIERLKKELTKEKRNYFIYGVLVGGLVTVVLILV